MKLSINNKNKIDTTFNKILNDLVKNNSYFQMPIHRNGYKFEYEICCCGINEYCFPYDDIERPNTYYYHYFSYELDDIIEEYKKNNRTLNNHIVHQIFLSNKNNLSDLNWILVKFDL